MSYPGPVVHEEVESYSWKTVAMPPGIAYSSRGFYGQCTARTRAGTRCRNPFDQRSGAYLCCFQHLDAAGFGCGIPGAWVGEAWEEPGEVPFGGGHLPSVEEYEAALRTIALHPQPTGPTPPKPKRACRYCGARTAGAGHSTCGSARCVETKLRERVDKAALRLAAAQQELDEHLATLAPR